MRADRYFSSSASRTASFGFAPHALWHLAHPGTLDQRQVRSHVDRQYGRASSLFNKTDAALDAVREALDAMREALAAFKEAQEAVIDQRVTARLERVKSAIAQWRAGEELTADIFFWLVKERAAFRGDTI